MCLCTSTASIDFNVTLQEAGAEMVDKLSDGVTSNMQNKSAEDRVRQVQGTLYCMTYTCTLYMYLSLLIYEYMNIY